MIGVIADAAEHDVVREFFELFKTPWEFFQNGHHYDVVLCAGGREYGGTAPLVVIYSTKNSADDPASSYLKPDASRKLKYRDSEIPVYGDVRTFQTQGGSLLQDIDSGQCAGLTRREGAQTVVRVGYDLFQEVRRLLTYGQPVGNAMIPTLELHIAFLRDQIKENGIEFVEIPPVPAGYPFIVCLTHDVDHPLLKPHRLDHTGLGFLYRALVDSVLQCFRGRIPLKSVVRNWWAAAKFPFVVLGLGKDTWSEFGKRYLRLEDGLPSTFFIIPFKGYPGRTQTGTAPAFRASKYGAKDICDTVRELKSAGCEISLHGLDAWIDADRGRKELSEIKDLTDAKEAGVRMHWLYFDKDSPAVLEKAGAVYDSTVGYNETPGYKAGTLQAFKPLNASQLLELPLAAMDTSLFYPAHLGLSPQAGATFLDNLLENASKIGGCVTVNWHDRSIFPERNWGDTYRDLLENVRRQGAWVATAGDVVAWFRKRRSATFNDASGLGASRQQAAAPTNLPQLIVRTYKSSKSAASIIDRPISEGEQLSIASTR